MMPNSNGKSEKIMLTVNKYKAVLLDEFYLDSDNITVRRNKDGWRNKYMKHDVVKPYKLCSHGYEGVHIPRTRTTVPMAHLILALRGTEIPDSGVIDHINGNTLDNSESNLRVTTQAVNCRNRVKRVDNTSGITGVSWNAKANGYNVRKNLNGKRIYLGLAKTLDEAKQLLDGVANSIHESGYTKRHGQ